MGSMKRLKNMKRLKYLSHIAVGVAVIGLGLLPAAAMALSVGPIRVMSNLNQSLVADISLRNFEDLDETQIKIALAENIYFTKAGVYKASWLNDLYFEVVKNPDDTGFIQLRTKNPIKDPVVDILINIAWPSGKMIRQYTVLLDPSDVSSSPVANSSTYSNTHSKKHEQAVAQNAGVSSQIDFGHRYGPVKSQDSLWQIAHKMVANSPYTAAQGILAIYEKNVDAFYQQNMNKLKEGAVLYLPEAFEVAQITASEAGDKIAASPQIAVSQAQKISAQDTQTNHAATIVAMQPLRDSKPLKILSPTDSNELVKKKSSDFSQLEELSVKNTQAIQQKLALLEEALDTAQRKNEQMLVQNSVLEDNNKKLVDAIHSQKNVLNNTKEETKQKIEPNVIATVKPDVVKPDTVKSNQVATVEPASSIPVAPVTPISINPDPQSSHWVLYLLMILGAASAGGYWIWRKKQLDIAMNQEHQAYPPLDGHKVEPHKTEAGIVNYGLDFDMDEALSAVDIPEENQITPESVASKQLNAKFDYEGVKQKFQEDLEKAELMIAYEKYDDAEKILGDILAKAPNHWLALLRLLELYVVTENNQKFYHWQQNISDELASIVPNIWSKIKFLDEKLAQDSLVEDNHHSNSSEFCEEIESQENNEQETNEEESEKQPLEFVVDENIELAPEPESEPDLNLELDLELDLDLESMPEQIPESVVLAPKQVIGLEQNLSRLENLAALTENNSSIELAKAFVLAGETKSAKNLLTHLLEQTSEADEKKVIEQLLVEID